MRQYARGLQPAPEIEREVCIMRRLGHSGGAISLALGVPPNEIDTILFVHNLDGPWRAGWRDRLWEGAHDRRA